MSSSWPKLTSCFQSSILVWLPCGWLWLALPPHLYFLFRSHQGVAISTNKLHLSKTVLSFTLAILSITEIIRKGLNAKSRHHSLAPVVYQAFGVSLASYILTVFLIHIERIKGLLTSGVLWAFWCLSVLTNIIPFYSNICNEEYETDSFLFSMFYVKFFCLCVQLALATIVERPRHLEMRGSPELTASVPSRLAFWWISRFIFKTYKEGLQEEDLFDLHPRDKVARVVSQFEIPWKQELQLHQGLNGHLDSGSNGYSSFEIIKSEDGDSLEESTPLISQRSSKATSVDNLRKKRKPSLLKVLIKTYGVELLQSHFFMLFFDLFQFVNPLLLGVLINYAQDKREARLTTQEWPGYVIALGFFLVGLVSSVVLNQCYHLGMTLGMRVKDALLAAVYKKSLSNSASLRQKLKVEETVKLMSVDCQQMQDLVAYCWMLWSAPLEIAIALYLLWGVIGHSMLWGIFVMILMMPINAYIAYRQRKNLTELAKVKDKRVELTRELVEGMQVYKIYTWECHFQMWIERIRAGELKILKKGFVINAISTFCWSCTPFLVLLATFANYTVSSHKAPLDAYKVFVSLALFNILRFPVNLLPMLFTLLYQGIATVERLGRYLTLESVSDATKDVHPDNEYAIQIERGHFTWDKTINSTTLSSIDIQIPSGQLVAVVGQSGCGKSSFLSAILGEMDRLHGNVRVTSTDILYLPQQAWVQSSSIKDNILFGKVKNKSRYAKVLEACCLKEEVDLLSNRDKTEIGERGIIMSESQKQRLALARATYSKADIYLMDEPLTEVDFFMADQVFNDVISNQGLLKKKTRVVATNNVHWLLQTDLVIMMNDGRVSEVGSYDQLLAQDGHLARYLRACSSQIPHKRDQNAKKDTAARTGGFEESFSSDVTLRSTDELLTSSESLNSFQRKFELTESTAVEDDIREREKRIREMLLAEERTEITRIKPLVFWHYFKAVGLITATLSFSLFLAFQVVIVYSNIWLATWTKHGQTCCANQSNASHISDNGSFYLGIYGGIGILQAIFIISFSIISSFGMMEAARILHGIILSKVIRSPMAFFDRMAPARIMTRFSRDVEVLDTLLPLHMRSWMNISFGIISTLVIIVYCTPLFLAGVLLFGVLYYFVQLLYVKASRQLKNLESTSRTSIYTLFRDTLAGVSTIRTFEACERFMALFMEKVEKNTMFHFASIVTNRWLAVGVEMVGNLVVFSAAFFSIIIGNINESNVGLAVAFALQMTSGFSWMIRALTDLETNIFSVQRMRELAQIAPESIRRNPFKRPQASWPHQGAIHFFNCTTQPRLQLYPALQPLNLYIQGGEKIGIVGKFRTEALSIRDTLFRIVEATSGSIIIDNSIISDVGLHDLRSKITYLPATLSVAPCHLTNASCAVIATYHQCCNPSFAGSNIRSLGKTGSIFLRCKTYKKEPVLFSGTLRMNLDPTSMMDDKDIWFALEKAGMKEFFSDHYDRLRFDCGFNGKNLSLRQRHLVCLARTLLYRKKILIMEESKGILEPETEDLIQTTIRAHFQECTVLTFAYRINTIVDYDRVIVLDNGVMVEVDKPKTLLRDKSSLLYQLASQANLL